LTDEGSVLVVCAMDSEAVHLRKMLDQVEEVPIARWRRSRGMISSVTVDLVVCGIGLAFSAAATCAALIDTRPAAILNYGCAGAHRADIHAGDVIVGSSVAHLASYVHQPDGTKHLFGFRSGEVSGDSHHIDQLPTDRMLVECARQAAEVTELPSWPGVTGDPSIHFGPVGSADIWTQHIETIQSHHATHGTLCEDMEAAAIAQIAALFGVPFLTIKDISNNELQKATAFEGADSGASLLDDVVDQVGLRAALLTARTIQHTRFTTRREGAE
jgi:adenosylhomocysteine nucleosidase